MEVNRVTRKGYCAYCFSKADLQCAKCGDVSYCSSICQRKHWELGHKGDCGMSIPSIVDIPVPDAPYNPENAIVLEKAWRKLCPAERSVPRAVRGLRNLGNTCFVNSSLQMILRIPHLVTYLQQEDFEPNTLHATMKELVNELLASPMDEDGEDDENEDLSSMDENDGLTDWGRSSKARRRKQEEQLVVLCRLKDERLNGQMGSLLGRAENAERYKVKMFDDSIKLIKGENLLCSPWSPQEICNWLPKLAEFNFGEQEDAHEFIWSLMRALEKEQTQEFERRRNIASAPLGVEYSAIPHRSFGGQFMSETICPKCQAINHTFEHFQFLSLSIDHEFVNTLDEALTMFTAPERLDKQNRYSCDACHKHVRARRRLMVYSTSPCLLIQIKRFTIMGRGKISKRLKFPLKLNLCPFKVVTRSNIDTGASEYTLMAVIVHFSSGSAFYGHYICYAVGPRHSVGLAGGSVWYRLDDGKVHPVPESEVLNAEAYLLLYESEPRPRGTSPCEAARGGSKEPPSENRERCVTKNCEFAAGPSGLCSRCAEGVTFATETGARARGASPQPASAGDEDKEIEEPKKNVRSVDQAAEVISEKKEEKKQHADVQAKKKKVGPNDPCICGSGKKYKKCHGSK